MATIRPGLILNILMLAVMLLSLKILLKGAFLSRIILTDKNNPLVAGEPMEIVENGSIDCSKSIVCNTLIPNYKFLNNSLRFYNHERVRPTRKLVIMVVDALRESFIDGEFINFVGEYPGYRMQIFKDLHNLQPNNLKMFTSIADMPTITNQRIKALTTGNIPTLFDMGGNSGSKEQVIEDSLVHQANYLKKNIRMYGDDFYTGLFPDMFNEYEVFPSLDTVDLDSNDQIVRRQLFDHLENKTGWDIILTHLLGIDHAGHTYNSLSGAFETKVRDVEEIIKGVIQRLPDNATLAIVSDHGLTKIGSHGGGSNEEINTFIAFYQKDAEFWNITKSKLVRKWQSSICPTLAEISKINIPFSSIGSWIPETSVFSKNSSQMERVIEILRTYLLNEIQFSNYLEQYFKSAGSFKDKITEATVHDYLQHIKIKSDELMEFTRKLNSLDISDNDVENIEYFTDFVINHVNNGINKIDQIHEILTKEWIQMYLPYCFAGAILFMISIIFFILIQLFNFKGNNFLINFH